MLAERSIVTDLLYGFNSTMYQELEFKDCKARSLAPGDVNKFSIDNEAFSISGNPSKGEGGDSRPRGHEQTHKAMATPWSALRRPLDDSLQKR